MFRRGIEEVATLIASHAFPDMEFDPIRDILSSFKNTLDGMSVEQKAATLRTLMSCAGSDIAISSSN